MRIKHKLIRYGFVCLIAALAAPRPAFAQVKRYTIDSRHSAGRFAVKHFMIATVRGHFDGPKGTMSFDPKDLTTVQAKATFDMSTVDTSNDDRDKSLREDEGLLEVAKYPTMTFESKKSEPVRPGLFRLIGDLALHGVTKSVVLEVEGPTPEVSVRGVRRIGATATTTINRKEFGITWHRLLDNGGVQMADEVQITLDLELIEEPAPGNSSGGAR